MTKSKKLEEKTDKFLPDFNMSSPKCKDEKLATVIVQDVDTKEILMTAYTNRKAIERTLLSKKATFFSRSRGLWEKGEESGNTLLVKEVLVDCDQDTLVYKVEMQGDSTCHTEERTCFYRRISNLTELSDSENPICMTRLEEIDSEGIGNN